MLNAYGEADILLTGNPTMSHFRVGYRKHTHFAEAYIQLPPTVGPSQLPDADPTTMRFTVDRNADALADLAIVVPLPDIYSGVASGAAYQFQWIPHLGFNMIRNVQLQINGVVIQEHTGEYMKLRAMKMLPKSELEKVEALIGHRPELIDPANAFGWHGAYPNAIRPLTGEDIEPSIRASNIYVPLQLFFCENLGQILPLCKLQSAKVEIVVTFRSMYELFTILEVRAGATQGQRIKPLPAQTDLHNIDRFLSEPDTDGSPSNPLAVWQFRPYIEAHYFWLGAEERRQWILEARYSVLFRTTRVQEFNAVWGSNAHKLDLFNCVTDMTFVAQRNDVAGATNGFDNYTNWNDPCFRARVDPSGNLWSPDPFATDTFASGVLQTNGDPSIIQTALLRSGGTDLFSERPADFFTRVQTRRYPGCPEKMPGIHVYSWAQKPGDLIQPSGTINATSLSDLYLVTNMQVPPLATDTTIAAPVPDGNNLVLSGTSTLVSCGPGTASVTTLGLAAGVAQYVSPVGGAFAYVYNLRVYSESYNAVIFADGIAGLGFAK